VIPGSFSTAHKTPREGRFSLVRPFGGLALGLLVLSWLTTEHIPPWVSWHAEVATFAGVWLLALGAVGTDLRLQGRAALPASLPGLAIPLIVLGVITLGQYFAGTVEFGGDALVVWAYVLLAVLALAAGFRAAQATAAEGDMAEPLEWLAWAVSAGAVISVAIALAQVFDLWLGSGWVVLMWDLRRPGANLAQPNHLATLLLMGAASVLALNRRGRFGAGTCALLLGYLLLGLAITESRAGFLGFFALAAWWLFARRRVFADVPAWAAVAAAVFYVACFLAWPNLLASLGLVTDASSTARFGQPGLRLSLWQQVLEAVLQRPWFGWGVLGVAEAHNAVAHRALVSDALSFAHNALLDLAIWIGVPLTLAFLVAATAWARRRLLAPHSGATWYGLALAVPLAVHSLVEFPFAYAYLLVPVAVGLGFVEGRLGARPWLRLDARLALAAIVATGAALIYSVVEYIEIEDDFRVVRFEQLNLGRTPVDHVVPRVLLLTQLGAVLTGSRVELRPGMPEPDIAAVKGLAMRYPWPATQFRYAVALSLNGRPDEAYRQMQVMRAQRGERFYSRAKAQFIELGQTKHPQLQGQKLP
jgi:O-antigen ligase